MAPCEEESDVEVTLLVLYWALEGSMLGRSLRELRHAAMLMAWVKTVTKF